MELGNLENVPDYVKGHVWRFLTSGLLCDISLLGLLTLLRSGVTDKGVVLNLKKINKQLNLQNQLFHASKDCFSVTYS